MRTRFQNIDEGIVVKEHEDLAKTENRIIIQLQNNLSGTIRESNPDSLKQSMTSYLDECLQVKISRLDEQVDVRLKDLEQAYKLESSDSEDLCDRITKNCSDLINKPIEQHQPPQVSNVNSGVTVALELRLAKLESKLVEDKSDRETFLAKATDNLLRLCEERLSEFRHDCSNQLNIASMAVFKLEKDFDLKLSYDKSSRDADMTKEIKRQIKAEVTLFQEDLMKNYAGLVDLQNTTLRNTEIYTKIAGEILKKEAERASNSFRKLKTNSELRLNELSSELRIKFSKKCEKFDKKKKEMAELIRIEFQRIHGLYQRLDKENRKEKPLSVRGFGDIVRKTLASYPS